MGKGSSTFPHNLLLQVEIPPSLNQELVVTHLWSPWPPAIHISSLRIPAIFRGSYQRLLLTLISIITNQDLGKVFGEVWPTTFLSFSILVLWGPFTYSQRRMDIYRCLLKRKLWRRWLLDHLCRERLITRQVWNSALQAGFHLFAFFDTKSDWHFV